jgi:carboxylate-amine ligase
MDAQTSLGATAALVALVQCLVALELDQGWADERAAAPEVLVENRFLAARDGAAACLIDPAREARVAVADVVAELRDACAPYAADLGCAAELAGLDELVREPGDRHQISVARGPRRLPGLVARLAEEFA